MIPLSLKEILIFLNSLSAINAYRYNSSNSSASFSNFLYISFWIFSSFYKSLTVCGLVCYLLTDGYGPLYFVVAVYFPYSGF